MGRVISARDMYLAHLEEWERFKLDHAPKIKEAIARESELPVHNDRDFGVYFLRDPDSGEVRYIGSSKDIFRRRENHAKAGRVNQPRLREWQLGLKERGKVPIYEIVELFSSRDEAYVREEELIAEYRVWGDILNKM